MRGGVGNVCPLQLSKNDRVVVDADGIRERLLNGQLTLDSLVMSFEDYEDLGEGDAGEGSRIDGSKLRLSPNASDEEISHLLDAAGLDSGETSRKPLEERSLKKNAEWKRIGDSIGRSVFSIRVLHQPV
jgi:hypothetical protein